MRVLETLRTFGCLPNPGLFVAISYRGNGVQGCLPDTLIVVAPTWLNKMPPWSISSWEYLPPSTKFGMLAKNLDIPL